MAVSRRSLGTAGFIRYWLPVIIHAAVIFCLSSVPGQKIPSLFGFQDIVFHVAEYAVLALLLRRAIKARIPEPDSAAAFRLVMTAAFLYAISDEFHQLFIPNRFFSLSDLAWDAAGIFIANLAYR